MHMIRGKLDTDTLVKLVLLLVIVWLALEILETVVGLALGILAGIPTVIGVALLLLLVLWLLDYI